MWSNNFCNIAFLLLGFIATSSEYASATVLCPNQPKENFCDCDGDCTEKPEWCQCEDAKTCCETNGFLSLTLSNGGDDTISDNILCPNQPTENYCDCDGDCTEKPEWCQCEDAKACCETNGFLSLTLSNGGDDTISDNILCPNQPKENYCDCDGDCTEKPEWCQCEEAQACCETNGYQTPSSDFVDAVITNSKSILCPEQEASNYCDCQGDCTANPDFCACDEAQECCVDATPVVFCPDQPKENYCDCTGDCTEVPEYCACDEGRACCAEFASKVENGFYGIFCGILFPIAVGATGGLVLLIWFLQYRNKKEGRQGAFVSEAATKAMSPPTFSSNSDEEETIASTARPDE